MQRVCMVVGWGRSGSTLLDRLLGQLPGWCSVGELRELWLRGPIENRRCGCGAAFDACRFWSEVLADLRARRSVDPVAIQQLQRRVDRGWSLPVLRLRRPPLIAADVARYRELLRDAYDALFAVSGGRVVIDSSKLASHALLAHGVDGLDIRFVHLVRDPRGVVESWGRVSERGDGSPADRMIRYGPVAASLRWDYYNVGAERLGNLGRPYLRLHHEDVIRDPGHALRTLGDFMGAPLPARALDFLDGHRAQLHPTHLVDGNPMRFRTGELTIHQQDRWPERMRPRDRRVASVLTAPLRDRYGYA